MADINDDLFAELLGEVTKPFEIKAKRYYDYVILEEGFEKRIEDLLIEVDLLEEKKRREREAVDALGDVDVRKLARPIIYHLKAPESAQKAGAQALEMLVGRNEKSVQSFFILPNVERSPKFLGKVARDLRSVLRISGIVSPNAIDPEVVEVICRSTREFFEIQMKTPSRFVGGTVRQPGQRREGCFTGVLDMDGGGFHTTIQITMEHQMLAPMLSRMSGLPPDKIPDDQVLNAVSEFVNILAGSARAKLNQSGYEFRSPGLPRLITPEAQEVYAGSDGSTPVEMVFTCELGTGWLEVRFHS